MIERLGQHDLVGAIVDVGELNRDHAITVAVEAHQRATITTQGPGHRAAVGGEARQVGGAPAKAALTVVTKVVTQRASSNDSFSGHIVDSAGDAARKPVFIDDRLGRIGVGVTICLRSRGNAVATAATATDVDVSVATGAVSVAVGSDNLEVQRTLRIRGGSKAPITVGLDCQGTVAGIDGGAKGVVGGVAGQFYDGAGDPIGASILCPGPGHGVTGFNRRGSVDAIGRGVVVNIQGQSSGGLVSITVGNGVTDRKDQVVFGTLLRVVQGAQQGNLVAASVEIRQLDVEDRCAVRSPCGQGLTAG